MAFESTVDFAELGIDFVESCVYFGELAVEVGAESFF